MTEEEFRAKASEAIKAGRFSVSKHGQEYFDRAGVIKGGPDADYTVVKVEAKFWGKWQKDDRGNLGGMEICWQTESAGFGSLTVFIDNDGTLKAHTEGMGPEFCKSVLAKLAESWKVDDGY